MKERFSLIHTGGPYSDETSSYDGHLNQPLTVREFIDAVFEQHPDEWGTIHIFEDTYLDYRYGEIEYISSQFIDYLDKKIKSFTAHGGWTCMDYGLTLEDE